MLDKFGLNIDQDLNITYFLCTPALFNPPKKCLLQVRFNGCVFVSQVVPSAPLAGDTDYSDPFDARLDHRSELDLRTVPCENNGYMEPYEAQRVITGENQFSYNIEIQS